MTKSMTVFMYRVQYVCPILTQTGTRHQILDKFQVLITVKILSVALDLIHNYRRDGWNQFNRRSARMQQLVKLWGFEERRNTKT
jgi:hypothetical protein